MIAFAVTGSLVGSVIDASGGQCNNTNDRH
jgi:hypothetical protein